MIDNAYQAAWLYETVQPYSAADAALAFARISDLLDIATVILSIQRNVSHCRRMSMLPTVMVLDCHVTSGWWLHARPDATQLLSPRRSILQAGIGADSLSNYELRYGLHITTAAFGTVREWHYPSMHATGVVE